MTKVDPIASLGKWELFALAQDDYLITGCDQHS